MALYDISVTFVDIEAESAEDAARQFVPIVKDFIGGFADGELSVVVNNDDGLETEHVVQVRDVQPDEWDHCEDDGSGWCILHDSRIVSTSPEPPYDVCEDRQYVILRAEADRANLEPDTYPAGTDIGTYLADEGTTVEDFAAND